MKVYLTSKFVFVNYFKFAASDRQFLTSHAVIPHLRLVKLYSINYRFRIVFARPHYNAVSVLKTLLYPQCACSNEFDACAFQYIGPRNRRHS